jgi:tryptophanyl-tRNA synthetase
MAPAAADAAARPPLDGANADADTAAAAAGEQVVTPWDVAGAAGGGGIDYAKLIAQFGCSPIDAALVARVEALTGRRAHPFLRRGIFFAHRCVAGRRF